MTEHWITIGVVAAPHGLRGELRVKIETDFPERFEEGNELTLLVPSGWPHSSGGEKIARSFDIEEARPHKGMVLLKLDGVDDRESAESLRGVQIVVARNEIKPLPEGSWYIFELEGLDVYTSDGRHLGVLTEVLHSGGNDVYVIKKGPVETLLPAIKKVVREVDLQRRRMTVDPLEEYPETS